MSKGSVVSRYILIILAIILTSVSPLSAAQQSITDINISRSNNELLVTASYKGGFTPEIKQEIINGVGRELFYYIVLQRVMPKWIDEEKISQTIKYTLKYDILKKQFLIVRIIGNSREERVFESYNEMAEWVSKIDRVIITPINTLRTNHKYYVSIKAEIKAGELPFLLRYLLFFIPYSEFSTGWVNSGEFMLRDLR